MKIAWGITGAGHLLLESVELLEKLSKEHEITILLSKAGEEVLKMYGLFERVEVLAGGYYRELALEKDQESSFPITGRLSMGRYDHLIISPTTSNTIAKIVHGIADSLISNAVAQAGKGKVNTYIIPVDMESGEVQTVLPSKLELDLCQKCQICEAAAACPNDAISPGVEINLLKCKGCAACQQACPFEAVSGGKIITIYMREIDVKNTYKLNNIDGIQVLNHPSEIKFD
ncbi:MAG: dihydromethanopterin reductase (acceptor) [Methanobacteriaceae archaeon]|nr:dihydromethanopterin reductase (acceptor) [Methanobacteriaceae archaeon]